MPRRPDERATLDSVAAEVGVSKATVSKVLNDRPGVSAATRERVRQAFVRLGYAPTTRPGPTAAILSVVVVFDTLANFYSLRLLDGLVAEAQHCGVDLALDVIAPLDPGPGAPLHEQRVRDLHARGHQGLLVVTSRIPDAVPRVCAELPFPVVAIDPPSPVSPKVPSVGSNNYSGGLQATEHLIGLGHRRIGFVGGSSVHEGLRERRAGYRAALERAGIAEDPELVDLDGMGEAGPAAVRMLEHPDPPTAFFASSDPGGLDVIRKVTRAGRRVPEQVSVVGYDDTYATVPGLVELTTVHTPVPQIGRVALATLVGMIRGEPPVSEHLQLATSLVVRESTGPVGGSRSPGQ